MGSGADGVRPSGTVTFLFTDIEGSTRRWEADADGMRAALAVHDEVLRSAIENCGGWVFKHSGDGVCAAFASARSAVDAAVAAQRSMQLPVRMGIATGEAEQRGDDYFGPALNRAARIMGVGHGGQIVVSSVTASLLQRTHGIELMDLGAIRLKGIAEPVHVFGVHGNGVAWLDRPLIGMQDTRGNLPHLQTEYVGRLDALQQRRLTNHRLVTLMGAGGVGKTRNAIEVGWLVVDEFADGAWLIELAPIADPASVHAAVASTLGAQPQPDMTMVQAIVDWCRGRRALIIIDNCEHVLDPVVELVSAIVAGAPTITLLTTSREPLGVQGEQVVRIPSLDPEVEGSELFCLRAAAVDDAFAPTDRDRVAIASICARLDGIPLAIELAAARIRSLAPEELLERLDDRFRLLRGAVAVASSATRRSVPRSSGRTSCCPRRNERCSTGCRCSREGSISQPPKRLAPAVRSTNTPSLISSGAWSTNRWWSPTGRSAARVTGFWRPCGSTARNG